MITKKRLDEEFSKEYERLYQIADGMINRSGSVLDASSLLAQAYLKCLEKLDEIEDDKICHFITSFCRMSTNFKNNPQNKEAHYIYNKPHHIVNFSSFVEEDVDVDDYLRISEDSQLDQTYSIYDINLMEEIEEFKKDRNIIDKILIDQYLYDYLISTKIHIDGEPEDVQIYKIILRKLKKQFLKVLIVKYFEQ